MVKLMETRPGRAAVDRVRLPVSQILGDGRNCSVTVTTQWMEVVNRFIGRGGKHDDTTFSGAS